MVRTYVQCVYSKYVQYLFVLFAALPPDPDISGSLLLHSMSNSGPSVSELQSKCKKLQTELEEVRQPQTRYHCVFVYVK